MDKLSIRHTGNGGIKAGGNAQPNCEKFAAGKFYDDPFIKELEGQVFNKQLWK